ncbi:hypothetical protein C8Q70DRAFT_165666 [Cubamyces menziesii]|nr:hypothetical protein C8Q70DRAFT_165666 [Cubamyces menziesii]
MISIPPTARVLITGYFYGAYPSCMLDEIFPLDFDPFGCFKETSTLSIEVSPEGHVCTLGMGEKLQRRTLLWAIKAMELIDQRNDPSEAAIMEHIGQCFSTVLEDVLRIVPPLQLTRLQLRMPSTIPVSQDLDLTRWLRHFTNLQCLDIKGSALSRTIVDVLKTDPQLLPCLKVVVLYLDTAETVPRADALEQWTLGRARAGSALDGVFIGPSNQEVFTRTLVGTLQQLLESVAKHVGRTHMVNPAGQPMRVG